MAAVPREKFLSNAPTSRLRDSWRNQHWKDERQMVDILHARYRAATRGLRVIPPMEPTTPKCVRRA